MREEFQPICAPPPPLVRPVAVDPSGRRGPTRGQAQGPRWRQTTKGCYVPASVSDETVEQRILEQSMRLPAQGAVTGWAACRLHGGAFFDGLEPDGTTRQPVPLVVPATSKVRTLAGSTVTREPLHAGEVRSVHGVRCTVAVRALFDEMRRADDPREAVVAMDMAAAAELVSVREMRAYAEARSRWRRSARVGWAVGLASERSLSPGEPRTRLIWVIDAGLPPPLVNRQVWNRGGVLLGMADLFDPEAGVFVEYDGAVHRRAGRHTSDVRREDKVRRAGLEYVKVTGLDLRDRALVADRMVTTRGRALADHRPGGWTTDPPAGWWHVDTAEDRLARRDRFRAQGFAV